LGILASRHRSRFVISRAEFHPVHARAKVSAGALALIALLTLGASGCGRRGGLEPPPDPNAIAKPDDPNHPQVHHKAPRIVPPKDPFVLDPLL
jgi:predicted small lipoprotein YifL